jgi:superfamily II DNA or RNA helicase
MILKMTKQNELQEEAIEKTIAFFSSNNKGYLDLSMRFGKTRCVTEFLKRTKKTNILIAYPDNKLKDVWLSEFLKWDYEFYNAGIYLTNFSSLFKYENEKFNLIIIDEFHSLSENEADIAREIMSKSKNTLMLSGTVSPETRAKWLDFKEIAKYTTLDGISDGILADYQITVHVVNLDNKIKTPNKKGKLVTEKQKYDAFTWVINKNRQEGRDTMHLALARNRLSLSSLGKMNYVKLLLNNQLKDKRVVVFTGLAQVADDLGIPSYHSKSKSDDNFHAFQAGKINHLALAAMGKVGVTYPDLDSVILLNFTYNKEETAQILNRAIKLDYHGKVADLHVITLNEEAELKKIKESLSMLDKTKIKYA